MLLKIETEVVGNFIIQDEIEVVLQPYRIKVRYDTTSEQHLISITKRVVDYENYIAKVEIAENQIPKIVLPDNKFFDEQITILRHLESFGAIDIEISFINWQNCSI